jgi:hypothetical protein
MGSEYLETLMLREAQHEQKIIDEYPTSSVRPEQRRRTPEVFFRNLLI